VRQVRVPGWRAFLARTGRTWAGKLEFEEIRESTMAYAWIILIPPFSLVSVFVAFALQSGGMGTAASMLPWLAAFVYAVLGMPMFLLHLHKAQDLVAHRLGLDPKAARKIDFRGFDNFDRSIAQARAAGSPDRGVQPPD
jgi:hypothetical protein